MEKICKNCRWLLKIHEETININRYHCIFSFSSEEAKNNDEKQFSEKDYTAMQTDITRALLVSLNKTCKYFEIRPKTISYIKKANVEFYREYLEFLNKEPIIGMENENKSLKLAIDTIRNVIGIKIPEIDIRISKMDINEIKKLLNGETWYKNHYDNLNRKYQNLLKLLKERDNVKESEVLKKLEEIEKELSK